MTLTRLLLFFILKIVNILSKNLLSIAEKDVIIDQNIFGKIIQNLFKSKNIKLSKTKNLK